MHSWLSARAAGTARPQDRPCDRQQRLDRPWSQYFCCMLAGNADLCREVSGCDQARLRAILKGADICASEPDVVARRLVEGGYAERL